jgi:hypothetical protein
MTRRGDKKGSHDVGQRPIFLVNSDPISDEVIDLPS